MVPTTNSEEEKKMEVQMPAIMKGSTNSTKQSDTVMEDHS